MEEALRKKTEIRPVFDGVGVASARDNLFTSFGNSVYVMQLLTLKIEKEIPLPHTITSIFLHRDVLLISLASGSLYGYNTVTEKIHVVLKQGYVVKEFQAYSECVVLGTADGVLAVLDVDVRAVVLRVVLRAAISRIGLQKGTCGKKSDLILAGDVLGNVFAVCPVSGRVLHHDASHTSAVTLIGSLDGVIYSGSTDGCIAARTPGNPVKVWELGRPVPRSLIRDGYLIIPGASNGFSVFSRELIELKRIELVSPPISDILDVSDTRILLVTAERDLLFVRCESDAPGALPFFFSEELVVGDNDEITDVIPFQDSIVVATNSSFLRVISRKTVINEESGEFACTAVLVGGPNEECCLALAADSQRVFCGTKDGYVLVYALAPNLTDSPPQSITNEQEKTEKKSGQILKLPSPIELQASVQLEHSITALCLHKDLILAGTSSGSLRAYRKSCTGLDLVFTAVPTASEITGICVSNGNIICASRDKDLKRIDMMGRVLNGLPAHKKGIWSLDVEAGVLASSSSDSTVKVWRDDVCVSVLPHPSSVVKVLLSGKKLLSATSDGTLRLWDTSKEKPIAVLKLALQKEQRIWSIRRLEEDTYVANAGGSFFVIQDNTKALIMQHETAKKREYLEKQQGILLLSRKRYVEAAVCFFSAGCQRELRQALLRIEPGDPLDDLIEEMEKEKPKALKYLCKWSRSPQLLGATNRLVSGILHRKWTVTQETRSALEVSLGRIAETLHDTY